MKEKFKNWEGNIKVQILLYEQQMVTPIIFNLLDNLATDQKILFSPVHTLQKVKFLPFRASLYTP